MTDCDAALLDVLRWLWVAEPLDDPALQARARELLLDTVGCAIAGVVEPEVVALFAHAAAADSGPVFFPGTPHGLSTAAFSAAFAAAACWHEACEGLALAHGRPGLHAIPAVLGLALARRETLRSVLNAVIVGYEVGGRMGIACRIRPGMHVDGTWGSFAAAAASCRQRGATAETTLAALNHVACHMPFSLYRPIAVGSTARNAYAGHGAAHGVAAATAAMAGLGGPPGSIAEMGRLALQRDTLPDFPGPERWLLLDGYLKPYPAVRHVHYAAAAAEAWHDEHSAPVDAITGVILDIYQEALEYCGNRAPRTPIQAQFSLSYGIARSLAHGRLDPRAYTPEALTDAPTQRLEAMVSLRADQARTEAGWRGCTLEIQSSSSVWRRSVDLVPGDTGTKMTRAQVLDKFRAYSEPVIGAEHAAAIANRLLDSSLDVKLSLSV